MNVPSERVTGLDDYDLASIFQGTLDVKILLLYTFWSVQPLPVS